MFCKKSIVLLILLGLLSFSGCTQTTVVGTGNEKYRTETEPPQEVTEMTEEAVEHMIYLHPRKEEIPPHYFKVRIPGVKSILYVFSDENGDSQFRVFGRMSGQDERGFYPVTLTPDNAILYKMELAGHEMVDLKEEKPGTPKRLKDKTPPEEKVLPHWLPADDGGHLYHIRDKNGEYQFRQWAKLGDHEDFYPANDRGILLRGGIPDAVKVGDKWVAIRIMNPMTFAYEGEETEEDEPEEVIISAPRTEEPDVYVPDPGTPSTEPPATEPPATEPPETEPPVTEPPETEPVTEPPETEPPETEPPETEPPEEPPTEEAPEEAGEEDFHLSGQEEEPTQP